MRDTDIRNLMGPRLRTERTLTTPPGTGIPAGWRMLKSAVVYERNGDLVITADPDDAYPGFEDDDDGHPHNCDAEGCGWEHVVGNGRLRGDR